MATNSSLRRYVNGLDAISMTAGTNTYYLHFDRLGSVSNLTNASGTSMWTYSYEPYGVTRTETKNNTQAPTNLVKFTGQY